MLKFSQYILLIIATLFVACTEEVKPPRRTPQAEKFPVKFDGIKNNTAFQVGEEFPLTITTERSAELTKIDVFHNDDLIHSFSSPAATNKCVFKSEGLVLGAQNLYLKAVFKNGDVTKDGRTVYVLNNAEPITYNINAIENFPHSPASYTQGLEFDNGQLYEGTGQYGSSKIAKVDLATGKLTAKIGLDATYFGEGITILGDHLYQLTWKAGKCFVYDKNTLEIQMKEFAYEGEGWGLTNDGTHLIMSDGTNRLFYRDPETFKIIKTVNVYSNRYAINLLNELEYVDGKIYANIYQSDDIAIINPETGALEGLIQGNLYALDNKNGGEVMNGIAYNDLTKEWFTTGKNWGTLSKVEFVKN